MIWTRRNSALVVVLLTAASGMGEILFAAPRADADKAEEAIKTARNKAQSRLNLLKLGMAMHDYVAANDGCFPPPAVLNKDGKAVLSWRVLLLPYLGEQNLYEQFKLSEPWDGPHNKKLLSKMPKVYAPPGVTTSQPYATFYQVFVSPKPKDGPKADRPDPTAKGSRSVGDVQAAFVQGQPQKFGPSFPDGISMTILIAEAGEAVPWTAPLDLLYAPDKPLPELGGVFRDVFHIVQVDGAVQTLTKNYGPRDEPNLRAFITRNGGEPVYNLDTLQARSPASSWRRENYKLRQALDAAREGFRQAQEERDVLRGRPSKKRSPDVNTLVDELKKENARLREELSKVNEERNSLYKEIRERLHKPSDK